MVEGFRLCIGGTQLFVGCGVPGILLILLVIPMARSRAVQPAFCLIHARLVVPVDIEVAEIGVVAAVDAGRPSGGLRAVNDLGEKRSTFRCSSACQKTTVIANQPAGWCTPGWSLLPFGHFTSWRSPQILGKPMFSESKMLRSSGGFPRQCAHWLGMTTFLTVSSGIRMDAACFIGINSTCR